MRGDPGKASAIERVLRWMKHGPISCDEVGQVDEYTSRTRSWWRCTHTEPSSASALMLESKLIGAGSHCDHVEDAPMCPRDAWAPLTTVVPSGLESLPLHSSYG